MTLRRIRAGIRLKYLNLQQVPSDNTTCGRIVFTLLPLMLFNGSLSRPSGPVAPWAVACPARPNFMKIAPIVRALNARKKVAAAAGVDLRVTIVHTGQHYDENMSEVFFRELAIPKPDRIRQEKECPAETRISTAHEIRVWRFHGIS